MPPPIPPGYDPRGSAAKSPTSVSPELSPRGGMGPESTPLIDPTEVEYKTAFSDSKPGEDIENKGDKDDQHTARRGRTRKRGGFPTACLHVLVVGVCIGLVVALILQVTMYSLAVKRQHIPFPGLPIKLHTKLGILQGRNKTAFLASGTAPDGRTTGGKRNVVSFKGIPFSELTPGKGPTRFMASSVRTTPWQGVRLAERYAAPCMQGMRHNNPMGRQVSPSEDCLYLNVWTPLSVLEPLLDANSTASPDAAPTPADDAGNASDAAPDADSAAAAAPELVPVVVFVHGGNMKSGWTGSPRSVGMQLAGETSTVVVSVAYRLGVLGFLPLNDATSTNGTGGMNGVNDVITGLQWVQEHISSFGGDPTKVTLMGHSAGGMIVCTLLASPRAAGLFSAVAMNSSPCTGLKGTSTMDDGAKMLRWFTTNLGTSNVEELQHYDAMQLMDLWGTAASNSMSKKETLPLLYGMYFDTDHWFVDNFVLTTLPFDVLTAGPVNAARVILGSNSVDGTPVIRIDNQDDMTYMVGARGDQLRIPRRLDEYEEAVKNWTRVMVETAELSADPTALASQILQMYPKEAINTSDAGDVSMTYLKMDGDATFVCPTLWIAAALAAQGVEVHHYVFSFGPLGNRLTPEGSQVPGSFLTSLGLEDAMKFDGDSKHLASHGQDQPYLWFDPTVWLYPEEYRLSERIQMYWSNLTTAQGPSTLTMPNGEEAEWPAWSPDSPKTIDFDLPEVQSLETGYKTEVCAFWEMIVGPDSLGR